jgi:lactate racemase
MLRTQVVAPNGRLLTGDEVFNTLNHALEKQFTNQRVLVLIPDHTRSLPLPSLFRMLIEILQDARQLDFMVALGTHPALSDESLNQLVGITASERATLAAGKGFGADSTGLYPPVLLLNHAWDDPTALTTLGAIEQDQIRQIAGDLWHSSLPERVEIRLNKAVLAYDHLFILGPTFPHEVVGFSGGAKYLFPGISGPDMINATHWLGALAGVVGTIGIMDTPVRCLIHAAVNKLSTPLTLIALVVEGQQLRGVFTGDHLSAWKAAVQLSAQRHIRWCEKPYQKVLSCAPTMYDELWTGAKAMYKLEPAVAVGGEVIIYAPHLKVVSHVHGKFIYDVGYHTLAYFLNDWERFKHIPLGVLAHLTHVRGSGAWENGAEKPNVCVTLSSQISPEDCARLNLGYLDPAAVNIDEWKDREGEGILYVPKAGEILYRRRFYE